MPLETEITELLIQARQGNIDALNALFPLVYQKLRSVAKGQLNKLRPGETLNTTALVHEAYLKLIDQSRAQYNDRIHFFSVAAMAMRQILLNYARRNMAQRRGGDNKRVDLNAALISSEEQAEILLALEEVLIKLEEHNERQHKIVELRFFVGMTEVEIGDLLEVTERTVRRDWVKAQSFLFNELSQQ